MIKFLIIPVLISSSQTANVGEYEDNSDCICDVTKNSCDAYCCCDSDCKSILIDEWDHPDKRKNKCVAEKYSYYGIIECKSED